MRKHRCSSSNFKKEVIMNDQNLIPNSQRSPSEVRENGRKGGIKSGIVRNEKKKIASAIEAYIDKKSPTTGNRNIDDIVNEALSGEITIRDLKTLAEILGELVTKQDITTNGEAIEEVALIFGKPLPKYDKNKGDSSSR
jgi:hypothetical protein